MPLDIGPVHPLTRPAAAHAIGVDSRTLRGWVESGSIPLLVPREQAGTWMRISPADVLRLAVFGQVLRFGFTMAEAGRVIVEHVDRHLTGVLLAAGDISWHLLRNRLLGLGLIISREPDGRIAVSAESLRGVRPVRHRGAELTVHVGAILHDVHRRARERDSRHA